MRRGYNGEGEGVGVDKIKRIKLEGGVGCW